MTAAISKQRKLSLNIDAPLYSMLEKQAEESGVGLNDFIARLLTGATDEWNDYCETLRRLSDDGDRAQRVCLKQP